MKIFVTGATGFIGTAVVKELISHGHSVIGLARSDESQAKLTAAGADFVRGDLEDKEALIKGASAADGTLHLGFIHDFSAGFDKSIAVDAEAIKTICDSYVGTGKFFVNTSGLFTVAHVHNASESTTPATEGSFSGRGRNEILGLSYADKDVRSIAIRLSPTVHGKGDKGFIPTILGIAQKNGYSGYIEDGSSHWPAVHRLDAAVLFRLAAEKVPAGTVLHGAAESGVCTKDIASAIGKNLGIPVKSVSKDDATTVFGPFFGMLWGSDCVSSAEQTKKITGWNPVQPTLVDDVIENY